MFGLPPPIYSENSQSYRFVRNARPEPLENKKKVTCIGQPVFNVGPSLPRQQNLTDLVNKILLQKAINWITLADVQVRGFFTMLEPTYIYFYIFFSSGLRHNDSLKVLYINFLLILIFLNVAERLLLL